MYRRASGRVSRRMSGRAVDAEVVVQKQTEEPLARFNLYQRPWSGVRFYLCGRAFSAASRACVPTACAGDLIWVRG